MLEEIKNIKSRVKDLRNFGITIGIIILIITGFLFYKQNEVTHILLYTACVFIGFGMLFPSILKPVYLVWMIFAVILGWIMTRVILSLVFYLIMTPIGLLARLLGYDFLKLKKLNGKSYWNQRESQFELNQDYEKQF